VRVLQLLAVLVIGFAPLARAQSSDSSAKDSVAAVQAKPYRNPRLAAELGLIPGWGHVYAGEYFRGYSAWLGTIGGVTMGPVIFESNSCTFLNFAIFSTCRPGRTWPYKLTGAAILGMGLWTWFSSARDAPHAAERANARHARKALRLSPVLGPAGTVDHDWRGPVCASTGNQCRHGGVMRDSYVLRDVGG